MPGQKTLTSFFTPIANKRPLTNIENKGSSPKKQKSTDEKSKTKSPEKSTSSTENIAPSLSPEQKKQIADNKQKALEKLSSKKSSPQGFGASWATVLSKEFTKPYFIQLQKFVEQERKSKTIFPPPDMVYTWTQMCTINEVKVVVLGQDPYHDFNQAHGLAFSVQKGVKPPPSLQNMYKELATDIPGFKHPGHGDLTGWAKQGVLLLNACLTVRAHEANSHKDKGWEKFTDAVISSLSTSQSNLVFLLWGGYAQKKGKVINKKNHLVLKGVHPSPLSAHRGFFGCKHFSQANEYLKEHCKKPIDWTKLD